MWRMLTAMAAGLLLGVTLGGEGASLTGGYEEAGFPPDKGCVPRCPRHCYCGCAEDGFRCQCFLKDKRGGACFP